MGNEELEQIKKRFRENSLGISRLPRETKFKFMEIAVSFEDDYGMTLKWILEQALEYQEMKKVFQKIYELDKRINILEEYLNSNQIQGESENQEKPKIIRTLGGKEIELKGGNNE